MQVRVLESLQDIAAEDWNRLVDQNDPFLDHSFMWGLEKHQCLGDRYGWLARHLIATENGNVCGVMPLYLKDNSYGELVFDWGWADAYHRQGLDYYPKLVNAVPYTPATGDRLLLEPDAGEQQRHNTANALIQATLELGRQENVSSWHCLFPTEDGSKPFEANGFFSRLGCQYHWRNEGYRDFDDFLESFTAKNRKKLKRERRQVNDAGIRIQICHGHDMDDALWPVLAHFYQKTFLEKGGWDTLNQAFFQHVGQTLKERFVVFFAWLKDRPIAAAICFRSDQTLYGRHWGSEDDYHSLHFELCYYQGIEYCIRHGLKHFEPGAQGEHKVRRGFRPTATWSMHRLAHPTFHRLIHEHVQQESTMMRRYMNDLQQHLPFKCDSPQIKP